MSRMSAPTESHISAATRPDFDAAARQLGYMPNMHYAPTSGRNALNASLDASKAMSTSPDAANRQGTALAGEEVNA